MTREQYMEALKRYLRRLPKNDYDNAIEYFTEYFEEAGPENEQEVIRELGAPREAARELLMHLLDESTGNSRKEDITDLSENKASDKKEGSRKYSPGKIILLTFLVLCASPVSLVLLVGAGGILAALLVAIASVVFSLAVTSLAVIAGGVLLAGAGFMAVVESVSGACMIVGAGFFLAGAGIILGVLTICICKGCAVGIGRLVNRMVRKRVDKHEKNN